jgi:hypothetical protein
VPLKVLTKRKFEMKIKKFITYDIVEGGVVAAGQEVREEVHHDETLPLSL